MESRKVLGTPRVRGAQEGKDDWWCTVRRPPHCHTGSQQTVGSPWPVRTDTRKKGKSTKEFYFETGDRVLKDIVLYPKDIIVDGQSGYGLCDFEVQVTVHRKTDEKDPTCGRRTVRYRNKEPVPWVYYGRSRKD